MLLGHGTIGQFAVAEALSGLVVNAGTVDVSMGQAATFTIGTETVAASANVSQSGTDLGSTFTIGTEVATGGATVSPTGNSISISLGEETAFGEAFQSLLIYLQENQILFYGTKQMIVKQQHGQK